MLTDSHAHIYLPEFDADRAEVISAAREAGVGRVLMPNIDHSTNSAMMRTAEEYPGFCLPMMGLHPGSVKGNYHEELDFVEQKLALGKYIAVGEVGIDLYWDKSYFKEQVVVFEKQLQWAKDLGLPVVIHARNSFNEIFEVLDRHIDHRLRGVFHCFTGGKKQVRKILGYKTFMFGLGGILTFENGGLANTAGRIPLEKIILETDSPYLAPVPFRGKRNQPAYVKYVARKLAGIKNTGQEEVEIQIERNVNQLFNLAPCPETSY